MCKDLPNFQDLATAYTVKLFQEIQDTIKTNYLVSQKSSLIRLFYLNTNDRTKALKYMGQYKLNSNSKENQCLFKSYVRISNFQGNMASIDVIKSICWMHSIMFMTHSRQITTVDTLLIYKKSNRHSSH